MTGLLEFLGKSVYPRFRFNKEKVRAAVAGMETPNKKRRSAKRLGTRVDSILTEIAKGNPCRLNPEVRLVLDYLRTNTLTLRRTQVKCESAGVSARLDLETVDADGKVVILEIKTGFRGYYELIHTNYPFNAPFEHLRDSMKNIHLMQLLFTVSLYQKTFPEAQVAVEKCAVLVVNEELTAIRADPADAALVVR